MPPQKLINPAIDPPNNAMIWAARNLMPTIVGAMLLAGIVSAGLSSASTFLTLVGFAISNDVLDESQADDARRLRISRITILAVGVATLLLAIVVPPNIFWITNFVGPMFAAVWGPVAFMSVWSKRITEPAAFWGLAAGFIGYMVPKSLTTLGLVTLPAYFDPILLGFVISLVTIVVVSGQTGVTKEESAYLDRLHVRPPELSDLAATRQTMIWPRIMIVWGLIATAVIVIFYTRPYQLATGLVAESGPYVRWSGELVIALVFGLAIVCGGLFSRWALRRFYSATRT